MSAPDAQAKAGTDRILMIAVIIAVIVGGAAYYLNAELEGVHSTIKEAKSDYKEIIRRAPDINKLVKASRERPKGDKPSVDVVTYLGTTFSRKFAIDRFAVTPQPERKLRNWKEQPYKVQFRKQQDNPIDRNGLIDTLAAIEKERPDLRTKDLILEYNEDSLLSATIVFSLFSREYRP